MHVTTPTRTYVETTIYSSVSAQFGWRIQGITMAVVGRFVCQISPHGTLLGFWLGHRRCRLMAQNMPASLLGVVPFTHIGTRHADVECRRWVGGLSMKNPSTWWTANTRH